jgi:hypothetical protein
MLRSYPAVLLGATLICVGACSTTFTSTWKAADAQTIDPKGKIIAAVFVSGDEHTRSAAEDALAKDLCASGAHGVPGYRLLRNEETFADARDELARLKQAGANEVVVMRVVGADRRPAYKLIPGSSSNGSDTPGTGNLPATVAEQQQFDTLVAVETSVYSLERDELLWSGTSRTANPTDVENLVKEVASAATKEMLKQGLLARR